MNRYAKLIGPLLGSLVMAGLVAYRQFAGDGIVDPSEWVLLATQVFMVVTVWGAANVPGWEKGKSFQAAVIAVLSALVALITDGITMDEAFQLVILFTSAVGVTIPPSPPTPSQVRGGVRPIPPGR